MDAWLLIWLFGAVLVCWCVGLYQRLLKLRLQVQQGLSALEQPLSVYSQLVARHIGEGSIETWPPGWAQLVDAARLLTVAGQAARNAPLSAAHLSRLSQSLLAMHAAWDGLQEFPPDIKAQWEEAEFSVRAARLHFNQLIADYNAALEQFPASLVVRLMGFRAVPNF